MVRSPSHATIHWHLKRHWHVPESLEKVIPFSPSTSGLREQCSSGPTVTSPSTRSTNIYRRLKRRLGHTLRGLHCKRCLVRPRKSPPHQLFGAVFLALKSFEHLCRDQIVLIATDNTTMVSYINKKGGMRSGSLCVLLWRLLSWCHPRGIVLRAWHIPGRLNMIADKLSRHNQVIQTEWSLSQQVFSLLCSRWDLPHVPSGARLQPGSITNSPRLYHRCRIRQPGQ